MNVVVSPSSLGLLVDQVHQEDPEVPETECRTHNIHLKVDLIPSIFRCSA